MNPPAKTHRDRGRRPDQQSGTQHPVGSPPVHDPANHELQRGVGVKERRKQNAQLRCGKLQFVFDDRCGDGKISAVHVIDDDREAQQNQQRRERAL
jgi:hypothetical protein